MLLFSACARAMCGTSRSHRGLFVVLEGLDGSGKTTQCGLLKDYLLKRGRQVNLARFPDRSTSIGGLIDQYLKREIELDDRAVHLLFSANRWEFSAGLLEKLSSGIDVICDRYAYSGVAFSAAKENMSIEWCKGPDEGLPEPDLVIFLDADRSEAEGRTGYGGERYEVTEFQKRADENFRKLVSEKWRMVDASRSLDEVRAEVEKVVQETIDENPRHIDALW